MRATTADAVPHDDENWAYEVKWDGYRVLGFVEDGRLRLQTRNLLDVTADFPALHELGPAVAPLDVVLDGEVVALDEHDRPSFGALQQRSQRPTSVRYMIFDLLAIGEQSTRSLPYVERRRLLDQLDLANGPAWDVSRYYVGDGAVMLEATKTEQLEGLVAKRLDSAYEPGRRSRSWLKLKNWGRQEFVVGGWMPGEGMRSGGVGSLIVGVYDTDGTLRYSGRVGTGFTSAELDRLAALLAPLAQASSPFDPRVALPAEVRRRAHFAAPVLVAEVAFAEWTHTGTIRQPSYKGLRRDKDPRDVVREG
jgi:bifunctional non-homologous end joining protein LigD